MLQELTIHNDKTVGLVRDVDRRAGEVNNLNQYKETAEETLKVSAKALKEIRATTLTTLLNDPRMPESAKVRFKALRTEIRRENAILVKDSTSDVAFAEKQTPMVQRALTSLQKKLETVEKTHPSKVLNINDVKILLAGFPHVEEDKTYFENVSSVPYLHVFFKDVVCTANRHKYANIMDKSWVLPPIHVSLNLKTGLSKVTSANTAIKNPIGYRGDRKPQPHIMRGNEPCYGDFLGAVVDAKEEVDVVAMVTVMQLFLEQANVPDDAGSFYPRHMMSRAKCVRKNWNIIDSCSGNRAVDGTRFYGYAKQEDYGAVWNIPVVEGGVLIFYKIPYHDGEALVNFLKDLKKPFDERACNIKPENVKVKKAIKRAAGRSPIKKRTKKIPAAPVIPTATNPFEDLMVNDTFAP